MSDLIEFLRARLTEDEEAARLATHGPWRAEPYNTLDAESPADYFVGASDATVGIFPAEYDGPVNARHAARHDPTRVLAEVAAKQRIIYEYERYAAERRRELGGWNTDGVSPILTALASIYADHPDYRAEWAPTA